MCEDGRELYAALHAQWNRDIAHSEATEAALAGLVADIKETAALPGLLGGETTRQVLRALLDADHAAALRAREAKVRAETLRTEAEFFRQIDMDAAADLCEQSAIGWDSSADDALRADSIEQARP